MALGSERLVGRAGELKSLEHALAELGRGRPGVLALLGEPGMGKTRLLAELAARAVERRQLVLSGSASELERELPFGLFVDALDDYVLALEPRWLDGLDDVTRGELGHVLPSFPAAAGSLQHERFRTHRAVRRLLEELTVLKPLVLLLDDVHWADSGSLELLGSLLRHPPAAPVLLAVAVRPRQAPERLSGALERAERAGAVARLELGALSAEEARELSAERRLSGCTRRAAATRSTSSSWRGRPTPQRRSGPPCRWRACRCRGPWRPR
jgi:predicted ATPase